MSTKLDSMILTKEALAVFNAYKAVYDYVEEKKGEVPQSLLDSEYYSIQPGFRQVKAIFKYLDPPNMKEINKELLRLRKELEAVVRTKVYEYGFVNKVPTLLTQEEKEA